MVFLIHYWIVEGWEGLNLIEIRQADGKGCKEYEKKHQPCLMSADSLYNMPVGHEPKLMPWDEVAKQKYRLTT
jgi:hypothetical protein